MDSQHRQDQQDRRIRQSIVLRSPKNMNSEGQELAWVIDSEGALYAHPARELCRVAECLAFARFAGYKTVMFWTQSILPGVRRRIYEQAGLRLLHEEPHHSFRPDLIGQTWRMHFE